MKRSDMYISFSHGSLLALFGSLVIGPRNEFIWVCAALSIVCAILSVTHAIREQARGGG